MLIEIQRKNKMTSTLKNGDHIWESWGRGYHFDGKNYPGVSSILQETMPKANKKTLENWRNRIGVDVADKISRESREKGTRWHSFLYLFVKKDYATAQELLATDKELVSFYRYSRTFLMQFSKVVQAVIPEKPIYSDAYGYAGTFDCLAIANNEKILLDWKTSRKPKPEKYVRDYYLQVAAYANAVEELMGETIDRASIVVFYDFQPPDVFKLDKEDLEFNFDLFKNRLKKFYEKYPRQIQLK